MSSIDLLQRALDSATDMMREVRAEDLEKPTPCADWNVRTLANHMTGVCIIFARAAAGEKVTGYGAPTDLLGDDPAGAYARAAQAASASWRSAGALERTITIPAGELPGAVAIQITIVDQLLHAHDLATALGRELSIDDAQAEAALASMRMLMTPERRGPGKPFGDEVQIASDASPRDRLLAFSGRQP